VWPSDTVANFTISSTSNCMTVSGSSSLTYTATGNVTGFGSGNSMTYNKANQLATITIGANTSALKYDAFGQRLQRTVNAGTPSVYEFDRSGNLLTETNSGTETDYVWLEGMPLYAIQPAAATLSALHTNNIGTVVKGTNASKTIVWAGAYDPNGAVTPSPASITQNLRFPGQHAESFFYNHNGFRDYLLSGSSRYMEADPIGLAGGMNPYIYALNNP
jgi:RHS repeat-associated protein